MNTLWKRIAIVATFCLAMLLVTAVAVFYANRKPPYTRNAIAAPAENRDRADDATPAQTNSLEGEWHAVEIEANGKKVTADGAKDLCMIFKGDEITAKSVSGEGRERMQTFKLDPSSPESIDITSHDGPEDGQTLPCIYSLKKDRLSICYPMSDPTKRPTELKTREGDGRMLIVLERVTTKTLGAVLAPAAPDVREFSAIVEEWSESKAKIESLADGCLTLVEEYPKTTFGSQSLPGTA